MMKRSIIASINCLAALLLAGCLSTTFAPRGFVKTDDEYVKTLRTDFEPKIDGHCFNCVHLEYE